MSKGESEKERYSEQVGKTKKRTKLYQNNGGGSVRMTTFGRTNERKHKKTSQINTTTRRKVMGLVERVIGGQYTHV